MTNAPIPTVAEPDELSLLARLVRRIEGES